MTEDLRGQAEAMLARLPGVPAFLGLTVTVAAKDRVVAEMIVRRDHCTEADSVKARNLKANPAVSLALEDGDHPYVVEGEARAIAATASVAGKFRAKYDWDILTDGQYTQLIEVTVSRRLLGG